MPLLSVTEAAARYGLSGGHTRRLARVRRELADHERRHMLAGLAHKTKNVGAAIFTLLPPGAVQALHAIAQAEQDRAAKFLLPVEAPEGSEGERSNGA